MAKVSTIDAEKLLRDLPNGYTFDRVSTVRTPWNPENDGWNISDGIGTVVWRLRLGKSGADIFGQRHANTLADWIKRYSKLIGTEVAVKVWRPKKSIVIGPD
jgi:hypothetical protein